MNAIKLLRRIVASYDEIARVRLVRYSAVPPIQNRLPLGALDDALIDSAMAIRDQFAMPFWDSVMLSTFRAKHIPTAIFDGALFHRPQLDTAFEVTRESILNGTLEDLAAEGEGKVSLALSSQLLLQDGTTKHIPLLDFHCPSDDHGLRLARAVADRILTGGYWILLGRNSFHLWGRRLLATDDLVSFLSRSLLFCPIVDRAYVSHQLMERACALRITSLGSKPDPVVVYEQAGVEGDHLGRGLPS